MVGCGLAFCVAFGFGWSAFAFGVGFGRSAWRWFRLSSMFVRVCCWFWSFAFGVDSGPLRLVLDCVPPFAPGVGIGRPVRADVSSHLRLGSAARVGSPSRDLAIKWAVCVVRLPCLYIATRIPVAKNHRPTGALEPDDAHHTNRRPLIHPDAPKAGLVIPQTYFGCSKSWWVLGGGTPNYSAHMAPWGAGCPLHIYKCARQGGIS